jgi:hypothetical protein
MRQISPFETIATNVRPATFFRVAPGVRLLELVEQQRHRMMDGKHLTAARPVTVSDSNKEFEPNRNDAGLSSVSKAEQWSIPFGHELNNDHTNGLV